MKVLSTILLTSTLYTWSAYAAPSHCVKLDETTCTTTAGCFWKASKKDGTSMKVKPHCRVKLERSGE